MQRYFIDNIIDDLTQLVAFNEEQSHHAINVMRMQVDETVQLVDPQGRVFEAQLDRIEDKTAIFKVCQALPLNNELPVIATIYLGLPKGDKLELIVQKATELGVHHIVPVQMKRSVTKWDQKKQAKKVERLQKIAQQAAEQSQRNIVPQVAELHQFSDVVARVCEYDFFCIADEEAAKEGESANLVKVYQQLKPGNHIAFMFGPEGGIDRAEIDKLVGDNAGRVYQCALGPRILRAETAPLYALSSLSYALELSPDQDYTPAADK